MALPPEARAPMRNGFVTSSSGLAFLSERPGPGSVWALQSLSWCRRACWKGEFLLTALAWRQSAAKSQNLLI